MRALRLGPLPRAVGTALLAVGLLVITVWQGSAAVRYPFLDERVAGQVVSSERAGRGTSCDTEVGFVAGGDRFTTDWDECEPVGAEVVVRYDGDDPTRATPDGWRRTYLYRLPFSVVTAVAAVFSAFHVRSLLRERRRLRRLRRPPA